MKKLFELRKRHEKEELTSDEALKLVFDTYCVSASTLAEYGLTLESFGYGVYQLRQNGNYLNDGSRAYCLEKAKEIMDKGIVNKNIKNNEILWYKIYDILTDLYRDDISRIQAIDQLMELCNADDQRYTIEDIERCVENWGLCRVEREYIEKFLNVAGKRV